ncbi:MAG: metallophosphoesterase family protein [Euryarchaeota archaeon]|nr:metallophosphoesterase family protein [Euryarchaeota archaeon]
MRILILSDAHGNSESLRTILEKESYDAVWFLGDITDYGPHPEEVLDILRELKPEVWVTGNHDYANAFGVDCHCGQKTHELSVYTREHITQKKLSKDDLIFLRTLPLYEEKDVDGSKFYFVHACPENPLYGYMFDFDPNCMRNDLGRKIDASTLIYGHTHFPRNGTLDGYRYFNPGSAGQPRDGDARAAYGIYDGEFHLKRIKYDVDKVVKELDKLSLLPEHRELLVRILRSGKI